MSMARPLLADPDFVNKAAAGRADEINTCIACNQACLDHVFSNQPASCLVNPRACHETTLVLLPLPVVGPQTTADRRTVGRAPARPALAAAVSAAERGFAVTLFERADELGGQFRLAMRVPGKEDFRETLRYYTAGSRSSASTCGSAPRPRRPTWRRTTTSWSRPVSSAASPTWPASTTPRWCPTPTSSAAGRTRQAGRGDRGGRDRRRRRTS